MLHKQLRVPERAEYGRIQQHEAITRPYLHNTSGQDGDF
jgi:hypothetical protein